MAGVPAPEGTTDTSSRASVKFASRTILLTDAVVSVAAPAVLVIEDAAGGTHRLELPGGGQDAWLQALRAAAGGGVDSPGDKMDSGTLGRRRGKTFKL